MNPIPTLRQERRSHNQPGAPSTPSGIVLIADDSPDAANSLAMFIELMGMDAYVAHNGLETVELSQRLRPEVIFMDLSMPRMNGIEATRRIRGESWGRGILICALTALDEPSSRKATRVAGFDQYLVKPASFSEIDALLHARTSTAPTPSRLLG